MRRPILILLLTAILATPSFAEKKDCGEQIHRRGRLAQLGHAIGSTIGTVIRRHGYRWDLLPGSATPTIAVGGMSPEEMAEFRRELHDLKEILEMGMEGNVRGYGYYSIEGAALRLALWGVLGAASLAVTATLWLSPDMPHWPRILSGGIAGLSGLQALRWAKTLEDNQAAQQGMARSNLFPALGPTQGPLQYALKQLAGDAQMHIVFYVSNLGIDAIRRWRERGEDPTDTSVVRLDLRRRSLSSP